MSDSTVTIPIDLEARREHERRKYLALAGHAGGTYGSTNHGRFAYRLVLGWKPRPPRFVVDFGCGRNLFIQHLRRLGIDGLGIDFAFPEADIVAPMHRVPVSAGIADVVTSFDALEHLLPEEVDEVLDEMRRIAVRRGGGRFVFSICTRESKTKVNGEGLHPTVRPLKWWLDRIGRVGTVRQGLGAPRYIAGVFNHA
ncbi:MAG: methyltransferase domain-containing protein [Phycisphaeraceae bacterium]|nr:methyltransferase domain-containing protein [Phycisphaeraceae bacterium]MBX3435428.1 methyltransferase domain-containing protein [Pirellulales bacterium]